jgi:hypothetical protein
MYEFETLPFSVLVDWDPPSSMTSSEFCNALMICSQQYTFLEAAEENLDDFCRSCNVAMISRDLYFNNYLPEWKTKVLFVSLQKYLGQMQQEREPYLEGLSPKQMMTITKFWEQAMTFVDLSSINEEAHKFSSLNAEIRNIKDNISKITQEAAEACTNFIRSSPSTGVYMQLGAEFYLSISTISGEHRSISDSFSYSLQHDLDTGRTRKFEVTTYKDFVRNVRLILSNSNSEVLEDILRSWHSYYSVIGPQFRNLSLLRFSEGVFKAKGGGDPAWWRLGWERAAKEFGPATTFDSVFMRLP